MLAMIALAMDVITLYSARTEAQSAADAAAHASGHLAYRWQPNGRHAKLMKRCQKRSGWHEWLFHLRLAQARPELALARGERSTAITRATSAIHQSRTVARGKYEAAAL